MSRPNQGDTEEAVQRDLTLSHKIFHDILDIPDILSGFQLSLQNNLCILEMLCHIYWP